MGFLLLIFVLPMFAAFFAPFVITVFLMTGLELKFIHGVFAEFFFVIDLHDNFNKLFENVRLSYLSPKSVGRRNVIADRVNIICADIKDAPDYLQAGIFDVVTCNPPYMIDSHGIKNPDSPRAIARHEIMCTFDDVARVTSKMLRPGGKMFLIHRPFRLTEIFETLTKYGLEPKRMKLVHPYINREPNMVLIEAGLGGRRRLTVERPLIVYESTNCYTKEIYDIYGY